MRSALNTWILSVIRVNRRDWSRHPLMSDECAQPRLWAGKERLYPFLLRLQETDKRHSSYLLCLMTKENSSRSDFRSGSASFHTALSAQTSETAPEDAVPDIPVNRSRAPRSASEDDRDSIKRNDELPRYLMLFCTPAFLRQRRLACCFGRKHERPSGIVEYVSCFSAPRSSVTGNRFSLIQRPFRQSERYWYVRVNHSVACRASLSKFTPKPMIRLPRFRNSWR